MRKKQEHRKAEVIKRAQYNYNADAAQQPQHNASGSAHNQCTHIRVSFLVFSYFRNVNPMQNIKQDRTLQVNQAHG